MHKTGEKFIIEIDSVMTNKKGTLYGIKGFNSLVFDEKGLNRLTSYNEEFDNSEETIADAEKYDYEKGLSDAWEVAKKICLNPDDGGIDSETIEKFFGAKPYEVMKRRTPQEAIDKLKKREEEQEIKVGDVIISNEGNKAVVQFITPYGEWECFNKCTYFTLNKEKQKFWKKTGKHIDLTEIFKALEVEDEVR